MPHTSSPQGLPPHLHIEGAVATITLDRPAQANKLTPGDLRQLVQHIETINQADRVVVAVLKGRGKHFCSGYDISEIVASNQTKGRSFGEMVDALEHCKAVTVAAVHGGVYGGATDMVLACDFRLGARAAEMFMPAARLGLHFYQSGLERFVTRLGADTAKRLFLTADKLNAQAMLDCGFLTTLTEDAAALDVAVGQLTTTLTGMAPLALLGMKKHINQIARGRADAQSIEAAVQRTVASEDIVEGGLAWKEKRQAHFKGR